MKRVTFVLAGIVFWSGVGLSNRLSSQWPATATVGIAEAAQPNGLGGACNPPTTMTGSPAETAWKIWVAATCPVNQNQYPYVVWENWIEQSQMYPADPSQGLIVPNAGLSGGAHPLHSSPLGTLNGLPSDPNTGCTQAGSNLIICEEVRLNGPTEDYIAAAGLWNRANQQQAAAAAANVQFPGPSVEIKADWIELSSCANPPSGVHIEQINGVCFALAGMHLISKLRGNWIWATFEPQNLTTNPNRCVALGCNDPWGSTPQKSAGGASGNTTLTSRLSRLMGQANLAPEWFNYRLDGVQTNFVDAHGKPTLLGNSIIEGENAGVPLTQSSCITCHAVSSVKSDGTDGITLLTSNPVGRPQALPSDSWIRRDFVWSLSEACLDSPFQPCGAP
jgi:hypothetical protein